MTACVFKGFYITLGDIHSNGKWYDVFICDGMESDVTVSDAERGPFNATMKSKFDNWGKSSNNSTKNNESTSGGNVTQEYLNALNRGLSYAQNLHMSKKAVYDQLTSSYGEGFPADAAQYAIDNMTGVDWNANALERQSNIIIICRCPKAQFMTSLLLNMVNSLQRPKLSMPLTI